MKRKAINSLKRAFALGLVAAAACGTFRDEAAAGEADVIAVKIAKVGPRTYDFDVTVVHADTGWDHYANKWEIVGPDGKAIATRVLYHPHVDEQPFTRSLSAVRIPEGVERVVVRAYDKIHGAGGRERIVVVPD